MHSRIIAVNALAPGTMWTRRLLTHHHLAISVGFVAFRAQALDGSVDAADTAEGVCHIGSVDRHCVQTSDARLDALALGGWCWTISRDGRLERDEQALLTLRACAPERERPRGGTVAGVLWNAVSQARKGAGCGSRRRAFIDGARGWRAVDACVAGARAQHFRVG